MKLNDLLCGLLSLVFGIAVMASASTFSSMPGQNVGPALFPAIVGLGLAVFGIVLMLVAAKQPRTAWFEADEWLRRPRMVLRFALVIASVVFYAAAVDGLGFLLTAIVFLAALWLAFGVARVWIAPLALIVTLSIHYGFYSLLRVPLPWGVLRSIAW